jgi:hypothetical protein
MPADFIIGAAIGAAAASSKVRNVVRQGLIYGVGGVLIAYDRLAAAAQSVAQSAREATKSSTDGSAATVNGSPAKAPAPNATAHSETDSPAVATRS